MRIGLSLIGVGCHYINPNLQRNLSIDKRYSGAPRLFPQDDGIPPQAVNSRGTLHASAEPRRSIIPPTAGRDTPRIHPHLHRRGFLRRRGKEFGIFWGKG